MQETIINIEGGAPPITINYDGKSYTAASDKIFAYLLDARSPNPGEPDMLPAETIYARFGQSLIEHLDWPAFPLHALITISDHASSSVNDLKKKSSETTNSSS